MQRIYLMINTTVNANTYQVADEVEKFPHVLIADVFTDFEYDIIAIAEIADDQSVERVASEFENRANQLEGVVQAYAVWTGTSRSLASIAASPNDQQEEEDHDTTG